MDRTRDAETLLRQGQANSDRFALVMPEVERMAETIAAMDKSTRVEQWHAAEALQYASFAQLAELARTHPDPATRRRAVLLRSKLVAPLEVRPDVERRMRQVYEDVLGSAS